MYGTAVPKYPHQIITFTLKEGQEKVILENNKILHTITLPPSVTLRETCSNKECYCHEFSSLLLYLQLGKIEEADTFRRIIKSRLSEVWKFSEDDLPEALSKKHWISSLVKKEASFDHLLSQVMRGSFEGESGRGKNFGTQEMTLFVNNRHVVMRGFFVGSVRDPSSLVVTKPKQKSWDPIDLLKALETIPGSVVVGILSEKFSETKKLFESLGYKEEISDDLHKSEAFMGDRYKDFCKQLQGEIVHRIQAKKGKE